MTRRRGAPRASARLGAPVFLEAIAHVDSLSHEGRGIARIDGKVTFIDGALPGEDVRIRYRRQLAKYDSAETIEVLTPSTDRVTPQCPHFGVCAHNNICRGFNVAVRGLYYSRPRAGVFVFGCNFKHLYNLRDVADGNERHKENKNSEARGVRDCLRLERERATDDFFDNVKSFIEAF